MKINKKQYKSKRKVVILNCKWKTFILSKNLIRNLQKLRITIPCSKTSNGEIKRYKLSILNSNIRERIIPKCLRHKCRRNHNFREVQQIKTKNKINRTEHIISKKSRHETLSHLESKYDDISSGSLSSYEDIESLMSSTRTRMKELNEHWEFLPRATSPSNTNERRSMNSLDTITDNNNNDLENEDEDPIKCQTNQDFYSPTKREDIVNI